MISIVNNKKLKRIHSLSTKYYLYDAFFLLSIIFLLLLLLNENDCYYSNNIIFKTNYSSNGINIIDFEGYDNKNGLKNEIIIPNIFHYLIFDTEMSSNLLASMISAQYYQKPKMIYIHHCDVKNFKISNEKLNIINKLEIPFKILNFSQNNKIFGKNPDNMSDINEVNKLLILMEYGGIYSNEDLILYENINYLRRFEAVTILNDEKKEFNSQLIMGHRNARIFKSFYDTFRTGSTNLTKKFTKLLKKDDYLSKFTTFKYMNSTSLDNKTSEQIKLWINKNEFMEFIKAKIE
jgi:hypothetical protein